VSVAQCWRKPYNELQDVLHTDCRSTDENKEDEVEAVCARHDGRDTHIGHWLGNLKKSERF
jgi:hypothetical protein